MTTESHIRHKWFIYIFITSFIFHIIFILFWAGGCRVVVAIEDGIKWLGNIVTLTSSRIHCWVWVQMNELIFVWAITVVWATALISSHSLSSFICCQVLSFFFLFFLPLPPIFSNPILTSHYSPFSVHHIPSRSTEFEQLQLKVSKRKLSQVRITRKKQETNILIWYTDRSSTFICRNYCYYLYAFVNTTSSFTAWLFLKLTLSPVQCCFWETALLGELNWLVTTERVREGKGRTCCFTLLGSMKIEALQYLTPVQVVSLVVHMRVLS